MNKNINSKFYDIKGFEPSEMIEVVLKSREIPKKLILVGELTGVSYMSDRSGKMEEYMHFFGVNEDTGRKKGKKPILATDETGKLLFIVDGTFKVTDRVIVG